MILNILKGSNSNIKRQLDMFYTINDIKYSRKINGFMVHAICQGKEIIHEAYKNIP